MSTPLPVLYTLQDLTEAYGWSIDTLYDYVRAGDLPAHRVGRAYYVTTEGLEQFLARRAVAPTDDD